MFDGVRVDEISQSFAYDWIAITQDSLLVDGLNDLLQLSASEKNAVLV